MNSLKRYSDQRNTQAFSKEALYSSDKFRKRLSHSMTEKSVDYNLMQESIKPAYLRRKQEQGKKMSKERFSSLFRGGNQN